MGSVTAVMMSAALPIPAAAEENKVRGFIPDVEMGFVAVS